MSGKDIRESVGLLLIVASMVFVGVEIQQNHNLARGQGSPSSRGTQSGVARSDD